jgi:hypothetical protein
MTTTASEMEDMRVSSLFAEAVLTEWLDVGLAWRSDRVLQRRSDGSFINALTAHHNSRRVPVSSRHSRYPESDISLAHGFDRYLQSC